MISIAASIAGCHPRTLRIYEEEGLLDPVRTETNIRLYSDEDLRRVRIIRYLTQVRGVNLAGVKLLLQLGSLQDLLEEIADALDEQERQDEDRTSTAAEDTGQRRNARQEEDHDARSLPPHGRLRFPA